MRPEELISLIRKQPFRPLRIYLTNGQKYDIQHPDQIIVSRGLVDIGVEPDLATGVVDRIDHCSLLHIVRVEDLSVSPRGNGNGRETT